MSTPDGREVRFIYQIYGVTDVLCGHLTQFSPIIKGFLYRSRKIKLTLWVEQQDIKTLLLCYFNTEQYNTTHRAKRTGWFTQNHVTRWLQYLDPHTGSRLGRQQEHAGANGADEDQVCSRGHAHTAEQRKTSRCSDHNTKPRSNEYCTSLDPSSAPRPLMWPHTQQRLPGVHGEVAIRLHKWTRPGAPTQLHLLRFLPLFYPTEAM